MNMLLQGELQGKVLCIARKADMGVKPIFVTPGARNYACLASKQEEA